MSDEVNTDRKPAAVNLEREEDERKKFEREKDEIEEGDTEEGETDEGETDESEPKKGETDESETDESERIKVEPKENEPKEVEIKKVETEERGTDESETKKVEPKKVEPKKGEPKKGEPKKGEPKKSKTIRKNILALFDDEDNTDQTPTAVNLESKDATIETMINHNGSELDRYMIALLRLQTEGRVDYRRLVGMHGGGFGTSIDKSEIDAWKSSGKTKEFRPLMMVKVDLDKDQNISEVDSKHNTQDKDDKGKWPSPQNNVTPEELKEDQEYLSHIFCWYGQPPFLLWHRAMMVEFERLLQEYDPLFPHCHEGSLALGAHYYDWKGWDGMDLPAIISYPTYRLKTHVFDSVLEGMQGYNSHNHTIVNPLYRWFAPMLTHHQLNETFPSEMPEDNNCTTREPALSDASGSMNFGYPFLKIGSEGAISAETSVTEAMRESDFLAFCTTTYNGRRSIENGHNLFHNRVGGLNGTMSSLQSGFDPIFFLHHSNVERQFMSWQRVWVKRGGDEYLPPKWLMETRLYPWTKPERVKKGKLSWNTKADLDENEDAAKKTANDATVKDWWHHEELEYEYDHYEPVTEPLDSGRHRTDQSKVLMTVRAPVLTNGSFDLFLRENAKCEKIVDSVSLIIGKQKRSHLTLVFDVTKIYKKGTNNNINNLFVRHKGEEYPVGSNETFENKSVRQPRAHMKAIRRTLEKHSADTKSDDKSPKWWSRKGK
uniref:Tyrosinase copper-binding domain-containing protein n=1 Tax=Ditylum brightwellii TaxID=49249 RepID=A0A7S4QRZ1_9STRA